MNNTLILTIIGLVFLLIGFKYLIFDIDLVLTNNIFAVLTYFLIGLGAYIFGRYGAELYYENKK